MSWRWKSDHPREVLETKPGSRGNKLSSKTRWRSIYRNNDGAKAFLDYQHGETECIQVYNRRPLEEFKFRLASSMRIALQEKELLKIFWYRWRKNFKASPPSLT
jgi:hypothetical protein